MGSFLFLSSSREGGEERGLSWTRFTQGTPPPIEREPGQHSWTGTGIRLRRRNRASGSRRGSGEEFSFLFDSLPPGRPLSLEGAHATARLSRRFLSSRGKAGRGGRAGSDCPRIGSAGEGAGRLA